MKILKIDDNNGYFNTSIPEEWIAVDKIDKDGLLKLLNIFLENEAEMDNEDEFPISNQAHKIIYKSIYAKLKTLEESKSKFKDDADRTYLSAIQKYSAS